MWTAAPDAGQPAMLLWIGQAVTLMVAVVTGWFALRSKRTDVDDARRARFDARVDRELDEEQARTRQWQEAWQAEHQRALRYERWLIRYGIDPETGQREAHDAGQT